MKLHFPRLLLSLTALSGASLLMLACAGASKSDQAAEAAKKDDPLAGAPDWVTGDCRNYFAGKPVLCGVGSVTGVTSPSLARNTAMARGRTEIARYLNVEVKSILTDYQAAKGVTNEQEIESRSTQISEMTLSGSRMASYFIGKDGQYYALMALELDSFKQSIESSSTIEQELKKALVDNATKAFSVQDSEISKY